MIPFINKGIHYAEEKYHKVKATGETAVKMIKYMDKSKAKGKEK